MNTRILLFLLMSGALSAHAQTQAFDTTSVLQEVVFTANREATKRSEAPVAISTISAAQLRDARATSIDQLLNKVSGVNMVNLGNEQHQMSIRQPITTKSLFLYLQDGIPLRTTGLFNHNALLEVNLSSVKSIEVIKGPSSALYGSEAIGGVVNFISLAPTDSVTAKVTLQGNNIGYKRADGLASFKAGRLGIVVSAYHADKSNGHLPYTDFRKNTFTARADYRLTAATSISSNVSVVRYFTEMPGGIDSTMYASKKFHNAHTFTYRKVSALRLHSTLQHEWNEWSKTTASVIFRDNSIGQNPAYRIKDDYRKVNGEWKGKKDLAHGEINESSFRSYAANIQHRQKFAYLKSVLISGTSVDISPSQYAANYIRILKDTANNRYISYQDSDSALSNYNTSISNYAAYLNLETSPARNLRVVSSVRYDHFVYRFRNILGKSAFSGSADTTNTFSKASIKVGATYNLSGRYGIYANYSEGFVPPQVTEMYTGVKVPELAPATVRNYEAGGWFEVIRRRLFADLSIYELQSTNEVISVRLDDGSFINRNAGSTSHRGIELSMNSRPAHNVSVRFAAAYSRHLFGDYVEKGETYSGNDMNGAPRWICNAEIWYDAPIGTGLRIGAEVQHVGKYYLDAKNSARYPGHTILNVRASYNYHWMEFWVNALNTTDRYYSTVASKSNSGHSYTLAEPISINVGCTYNFAKLFKTLKNER